MNLTPHQVRGMSIRVVVADDQDLVRTGLVMILGAQPGIDVVGEAADGIQALEVATRLRPDVLLVDIRMPGLDGVEVTRRLAGPDVADPMAVVVITTFDLDEYVLGPCAPARAASCSRTPGRTCSSRPSTPRPTGTR
jgi:DNA-binding NarL/FixJ family response regulator